VVAAILRSAHSATPDRRLNGVLAAVRRHWLVIARKRYPTLRNDLEDAVQVALAKLVSPEKLSTLRDATRLDAWARSIFVNTVLDLVRDQRRQRRHRLYIGSPADDEPEETLRDLPTREPTPEDTVAYRERLQIVARCVAQSEVAKLKFVDDLPDKEIAARVNLTRDGVAGQLKRIRKGLRSAFGDPE